MANYKQGSRGEIVRQIQQALNLMPDGIWGPLTTEGVISYQREHNLTPDGIAGPKTLASILKEAPHSISIIKSRRKITDIVVHCTATNDGKPMTVEQIRRIHKANGWSDIGYHYVIYLDGSVHLGRDVNISGAHVSGHNPHSIGIVYVGGLRNDIPADTRTNQQKASLTQLLRDLRREYPQAVIKGHRDYSPDINGNGIIEPKEWIKECPCFDARKEYARI